ncbi:toxic anion resistance protein [Fodinisporobacter ferrooxydans]|uniref:Toxic anion resistance protein n=1 Tax=Fodinisporobacter ferrooxydans TaxID=2901836 RepID=A0ABY4CQC6_9BACL|nr:toxic anion resistance protein [Alicyclobacillaceae bacterium MYW30-H2]
MRFGPQESQTMIAPIQPQATSQFGAGLQEAQVLEIKDDGQLTTNEMALRQAPAVIAISQKLNVNDKNAILEFGNDPAVKISSFADRVLHTIKSKSVTDSGEMLKQLATVMKNFDHKDFEEEKTGLFGKIFGNAKATLEKMFAKYQTIGNDIDKIYKSVNTYKNEINNANLMLEDMFAENLQYYHELEKYVAAGNMVVEELERDDLPYFEQKAQSGSQEDLMNLENLRNVIELIKQRVYDLELAKVVAMQNAPQIRLIQKGNYNLIMKIHSAFIVTIPVFKIGLIQAITLKRQKLIADSMSALDDATNRMLLQNAQNIKTQGVEIARLSGQPSVKIETVEQTWRTILEGIEDTRRIEEENRRAREDGTKRLSQLQRDFRDKMKTLALSR